MLNIMKSQVYQLLRDKLMWMIIIVVFLMSIFSSMEHFDLQTTGSEMVATLSSFIFMFANIITLVVVANVMGKDFMDKTLNYEIMSGHSRGEVFFGRMIVALAVGPLLSFLALIFIPVLFSCLYGWGNSMDLSGVIWRYGLVYINQFRIGCEVVLLSAFLKNAYLTYIVGFLLADVQLFFTTLKMHYDVDTLPLMSICYGNDLVTFSDWSTFFLNEKDQMFYTSETSLEMILTTLLLTVIVGSILTFISYFYFKKDDLS